MDNIIIKDNNIIFGDYVISRHKNVFNDKYSYWISKKYYSVAFYCFSETADKDIHDIEKMLYSKDFLTFKKYFDEAIKK